MTHYFSPTDGPVDSREVRVTLVGAERTLHTAPGVFSADGLDVGTAVLLDETPAPAATGTLLDLGCGWGPIALSLALESPGADVVAIDVNPRALALVRKNAELCSLPNLTAALPDDVDPELRFDEIWSNPPIRIGKQALHEMLERWLPTLTPGGTAWLVVQKHLGADSLVRWLDALDGFTADRFDSKRTFRILRVRRLGDQVVSETTPR